MAPRHRKPKRLTPRARRSLLGLAMASVLALVAGVALGSAIGDVKDCGEDVTVDVAAAPEIAPIIADYTESWSSVAAPSKGVCVSVDVTSADSASVATAYAEKFNSAVDVGDAEVTDVKIPDVWVPESITWLARLGGDLDGHLATRDVSSVAESPVGVVIPESRQEDSTVARWDEIAVKPADVRANAAMLNLALDTASGEVPIPPVGADGNLVASASQVRAHNNKHPDDEWVFTELEPKVRAFDYPFINQSKLDSDMRRATEAVKAALTADEFTTPLTKHGMNKAGPYPQPVDPKDVEKALEQNWPSN